MMTTMNRLLAITLLSFLALSCGRYGPPLPPEAFSPAGVENIRVATSANGVELNWSSPQKDRRGEELVDLTHYDVLRYEIVNSADSDLVAFLKDPVETSQRISQMHSREHSFRAEKEREALKQKSPVRNIEIPEELRNFTFTDATVVPGKTYLYSIVPYGRDGLPGEIDSFPQVTFQGDLSKIEILSQEAFEKPYLLTIQR